jgi:hypothetical protein
MIFVGLPLPVDEDTGNGASETEGEEGTGEEYILTSEDGIGC